MSCPNFIHAWKYECNTRHFKSMHGLRVAGFLKYNVSVNCPAWKSKCRFLHANFVSIFLVFASVIFLKVCMLLEDRKMYIEKIVAADLFYFKKQVFKLLKNSAIMILLKMHILKE